MLMHYVRRLLIFISALALAVAIGGWLVDHSVLRSSVVLAAVKSSGTCGQIADAAPKLLVERLTLPLTSESQLKGMVTPTYVCSRLDQFLPQLEAYYRNDGPPPRLDLRDLAVEIKGAGVSLSPAMEELLATPISYSNQQIDQPVRHLAQSSQRYTGLALLVAVTGMVLIWLIGGHGRWRAVAGVWISAAVILALEAGLVRLMPTFVTSPLTSSWLAAIATPVRQLADAITSQAARQFLVAALACVAVAIVLTITGAIFTWRHKHPHKPHQPEPTI